MKKEKSAYAKSGVDIGAADIAVGLMKAHVALTYTSNVLSTVGTFGGLFDVSLVKNFEHPVLVPSIDGVGTKTTIAQAMDQWTIGQDIVNHCVNDILTLGAKPLFFTDYVAMANLKPEIMGKIVENMAIACKQVGIPLISGETAEMPGIYLEGQHDVVGSIVGVVEKNKIIDGSKITEGDVLIGLRSNGIHTNGISLARKAFFETASLDVNSPFPESKHSLGAELLRVHKCYLDQVYTVLDIVHGIAHITGGGLIDNIARLLPEGLYAEISNKWEIPLVFKYIQEIENVLDEEMRRVFNLGIGMVLIIPPERIPVQKLESMKKSSSCDYKAIGTIKKMESEKTKKVVFTF